MRGTVHRALKLQHHSHTGKRLHHHHTSYRALFLVLAAMALSIGMIQRASADNLAVSATVPSAVLDTPAQITSPLPTDVMVSAQITVSGTCQVTVDGTIVMVERVGAVLGSAPCQSNGTFSLPVTLLEGQNALLPKVVTGLGVPGPDGSLVMLTWTPPLPPPDDNGGGGGVPAAPPSTGSTGGQGTGVPVAPRRTESAPQITPTDNGVLTYQVGRSTTLTFEISEGQTPYTVVIDWGDGSALELVTVDAAGKLSFSHVYNRGGFHVIVVKGTDRSGATSTMQVVGTTAFAAPVTVVSGPNFGASGLLSAFGSPVTRIIWGLYLTLVGAVVTLWLLVPQRPVLGHVTVSHRHDQSGLIARGIRKKGV